MLLLSAPVLSLSCVAILLAWYVRHRRLGNLPPGPKPLPMVGNVLNAPQGEVWKTYQKWSAWFGPILHFRTFGQSVVVLTDVEDAVALFEKRSNNYSERTQSAMARLTDWDWSTLMTPYGDQWRLRRKFFHQRFHEPSVLMEYVPIQQKWAHRLVDWFRASPMKFAEHFTRYAASVAVEVTYGHEAKGPNDRLLHLIETNLATALVTLHFGAYFVDYAPFLKNLPGWFPGTAGFRKAVLDSKVSVKEIRTVPFDECMERIKSGREADCNITKIYEGLDAKDPEYDMKVEALRDFSAGTFMASVDTTGITLECFFVLMVAYPEEQKRARVEILKVIGDERRLPVLSDKPSMPYVDALVKEVMRFMPASPGGAPHAVARADTYKGYDIPAETTIFAYTWNLLRDPNVYKDPETFRPERFMGPNPERDPAITGVFGFGRRKCPGNNFALNSVFLVVACVLSQFAIEKARDQDGNPIPVELEQIPGLTGHPVPFQYELKPLGDK